MPHKAIMILVATLGILTVAGYIGAAPKADGVNSDGTSVVYQNGKANHHPRSINP